MNKETFTKAQLDELIEHWKSMEKECMTGTGDMYGAELAHNSIKALESLSARVSAPLDGEVEEVLGNISDLRNYPIPQDAAKSLIRRLSRRVSELEKELEAVSASHDDEEAAHKQTLRMLDVSKEKCSALMEGMKRLASTEEFLDSDAFNNICAWHGAEKAARVQYARDKIKGAQ